MKNLSGHPHRSLHPEPLVLSTTNQVRAHYNNTKTHHAINHSNKKQNKNENFIDRKIPFSRFLTCLEERVILILWICSWGSSKPGLVGFIAAYAIVAVLTEGGRESEARGISERRKELRRSAKVKRQNLIEARVYTYRHCQPT